MSKEIVDYLFALNFLVLVIGLMLIYKSYCIEAAIKEVAKTNQYKNRKLSETLGKQKNRKPETKQ